MVVIFGTALAVWQADLWQTQPTNNTQPKHALSLQPTLPPSATTDPVDVAKLIARIEHLESAIADMQELDRTSKSTATQNPSANPPVEQVNQLGSADWFDNVLTEHRETSIAGDWAATMTENVETLIAGSAQSEYVNLSFLDCRGESCELHLQILEQAPLHTETLLLGSLGRLLPQQQIRRDGKRLTIIATQSS